MGVLQMFKNIVDLFNRNIVTILLLMVIVILPITCIIYVAVIYYSSEFEGELSAFVLGFSVLINFIICIPPFLLVILKDLNDEKASLKECLKFFSTQFGPLLFSSFLFYTLAIYTSWMLFIPTFILLLFTMIYPFYSDYPTLREMFVHAKDKIIEENIAIIVDVIIITSTLVFLWAGISYFIQNFDNNIISFMLIRSTLNMGIFPMLYIYLTLRYRDNEEEFSLINV